MFAPQLLAAVMLLAASSPQRMVTSTQARALRTQTTSSASGWTGSGLQVSGPDTTVNDRAVQVSDGAGGTFIAWRMIDECSGCSLTPHIVLQHVAADGSIPAGWPPEGLRVSTDDSREEWPAITTDGGGGAIVAWTDFRGTTGSHIYAQRVGASGAIASGWPQSGVALGGYPYLFENSPVLCADSSGGVFAIWVDQTGQILLAQHVTGSGAIASGWPANGVFVCQAPGTHAPYDMVADGSGGMIATWDDTRTGVGQDDVYALRLTAAGAIPAGWSVNGNAICALTGYQGQPRICSDGAHGAILAWMDGRNDPSDIYAQRIRPDGTIPAGWLPEGNPISQAPWAQTYPVPAADDSGGAVIAWSEFIPGGQTAVYASRVESGGQIAPGWPADGLLLASPSSGQVGYVKLVPDGMSGGVVSWDDEYNFFAQRLTASGQLASGWPSGGLLVRKVDQQFVGDLFALAPDQQGGCILAWSESRFPAMAQIFAAHVTGAGVVPVAMTLESVHAQLRSVLLTWYVTAPVSASVTVERRSETSDWMAIGAVPIDGTDRVTFEDRGVNPGDRYAYRIAIHDGSGAHFSSEAWVDIPLAAAFALVGLRPSPATAGELHVLFSLSSAAPATLAMYDARGRRMFELPVERYGAGSHVLDLDGQPRPSPGVYWLRLTQGARSVSVRAVIVR